MAIFRINCRRTFSSYILNKLAKRKHSFDMESIVTVGNCSIKQEPVEVTPVTSNRKERKRTHCINLAFSELRKCIPNVPKDTKLSKIKTLRLAISYIQYLTEVLDTEADEGMRKAKIIAFEIASKNDRVAKRKRVIKNVSAPLYQRIDYVKLMGIRMGFFLCDRGLRVPYVFETMSMTLVLLSSGYTCM